MMFNTRQVSEHSQLSGWPHFSSHQIPDFSHSSSYIYAPHSITDTNTNYGCRINVLTNALLIKKIEATKNFNAVTNKMLSYRRETALQGAFL